MSSSFKSVGDLFSRDDSIKKLAQSFQRKPWTKMTEDEKMEYLIDYCARNAIWSRSKPPMDREWFLKIHFDTAATWDDVKSVIDYKEPWLKAIDDENTNPNRKKRKVVYTNLRQVVMNAMTKYLVGKKIKQQSRTAKTIVDPGPKPKGHIRVCQSCKLEFPQDTSTCPKCLNFLSVRFIY